jgi:hypothetical protein
MYPSNVRRDDSGGTPLPLPLLSVKSPEFSNLAGRFCQLPPNKRVSSENIENKEVGSCWLSVIRKKDELLFLE